MLVDRGLKVTNVEVVGDAYAIASNDLRKTGAILHIIASQDALLEIIGRLFHRGECNRIRLVWRRTREAETSAASNRFETELV
jgi:hypothetical protein